MPTGTEANSTKSCAPGALAAHLAALGIPSEPCASLRDALSAAEKPENAGILVCGSLFLAGEALVALGAYPWPADRFDASELLRPARRATSDID